MVQRICYTFLVFIYGLFFIIISRSCKLLKHRLPGIFLLAVFLIIIIVIKYSRICEIFKIAPYLVIAAIKVIPVIARRVERIVADGIKDSCHSGILLIGILDMCFAVNKCRRIIEHIVHRIHKDICEVDGDGHEKRKADDNKNASHERAQYLPVRLPHFIIKVKAFSCYRHYGKDEHHNYTDGCHAPVDSIYDFIAKKHIDKVFIIVFIFSWCYTRKNTE